jgi:hypothetical protein
VQHNIAINEWKAACQEADRRMKESNGHSYIRSHKTRCQYCGRSPKQRGKCARWFDTFVWHLWVVLGDEPLPAPPRDADTGD